MQSVTALRELLTRTFGSAYNTWHINRYVNAIITHAMMCRAKVDAPSEAFRAFVARTCKMTRQSGEVCYFHEQEDDDPTAIAERRAACEALFDLIMEGV